MPSTARRERAAALATLDRFIKLHPSSPALDYALYLRGLVNFNDNLGFLGSLAQQDLSERDQQASRDSYQAFRQLVTQFPQSRYAEDAQLRMDYIVNALANVRSCMWRATTCGAAPSLPQPTEPSKWCRSTRSHRPTKKPFSSCS